MFGRINMEKTMDNIQELLEVLDEISEMNDQECERLEAQFKLKNIFK